MDRQQAGRTRIGNVPDHLHYNAKGWSVLPAADRFRLGDHEIAILGAFPVGFLNHELVITSYSIHYTKLYELAQG